ncbi:hypothetical protein RM844_03265 [Streptomyces sp. DSM 44915]|uniref:ATP-binding protein n=1 Tax=Streptomyces chisholmiae TaxID=3075540 RepID=A0ABU2JJY7_9ACTN|nr:hypothetical protein [Streptomyces sp. DSM 44915]MDT0265306.1 hypothetical protein [Streptomyces sp. DSM 44915]
MKHATAKTLGVAALGAAFAATAAGSASAMSLNEGLATATGQVASSIPVEDTVNQVAGGNVEGVGSEVLRSTPTNGALTSATETLTHTTGAVDAQNLLGGLAPGALGTVENLGGVSGVAGSVTGALGALS